MTDDRAGPNSGGPSANVPSGKVPVMAVVAASWKFLGDNVRLLLPGALVIAIISGVAPLLLSAGKPMTQGTLFLASIVQLACNILFSAMVLRKAVRGEFNAPVGLAFGQDESRLLGVNFFFGLLLLPLMLTFSIVFMSIAIGQSGLSEAELEKIQNDDAAVGKLLADALTSQPGIMLCILAFVVFLVIFARLSMAGAASIGEKKVVFLQTWAWSKGNVVRVIGAVLLTWGPAFLINIVLPLAAAGLNTANSLLIEGVLGAVLNIVLVLTSVPFAVMGAELYRGLRPPGFVAK